MNLLPLDSPRIGNARLPVSMDLLPFGLLGLFYDKQFHAHHRNHRPCGGCEQLPGSEKNGGSVKLALRYKLPAEAPKMAAIGTKLIEVRLVTNFSHGGILIGSDLYHSNAAHGVHKEADADLSGYMLIDLGDEHDARALALFAMVEGKDYDWFSLGAFVITNMRDSERWYCFELCYLLMTGNIPLARVTGEVLLTEAISMGGVMVNKPPAIKYRAMEIAA